MALIMAAPPVALVEPEIVEDYGAIDVFATGWTMQFSPEIITGISHIDSLERGILRRRIVVRTHYPRCQWLQAVEATVCGIKGGGAH